ncbi:hypothetical protein NL533_34195, partial [Klebsiella pneumoniae]|nr:hypothetical protein [Klebsiella pneumoniae]
DAKVDDGRSHAQFPDDEKDKGYPGNKRHARDERGTQPVILLSLVQYHLQAPYSDGYQPQAPIVYRAAFPFQVRRVFDDERYH